MFEIVLEHERKRVWHLAEQHSSGPQRRRVVGAEQRSARIPSERQVGLIVDAKRDGNASGKGGQFAAGGLDGRLG